MPILVDKGLDWQAQGAAVRVLSSLLNVFESRSPTYRRVSTE